MIRVYEVPGVNKFIETESRMVTARGWGTREIELAWKRPKMRLRRKTQPGIMRDLVGGREKRPSNLEPYESWWNTRGWEASKERGGHLPLSSLPPDMRIFPRLPGSDEVRSFLRRILQTRAAEYKATQLQQGTRNLQCDYPLLSFWRRPVWCVGLGSRGLAPLAYFSHSVCK